jgi:hypothetical protein
VISIYTVGFQHAERRHHPYGMLTLFSP